MRILLAAPNRDLLRSYQKILESAFGETITAFDGTQVLSTLAEGRFDLAILDSALPRIALDLLIGQLEREDIPVVILSDQMLSARLLSSEPVANAYLAYPFSPDEVRDVIHGVMRWRGSQECFDIANTTVEFSAFRLRIGPRLTVGELDLLFALLTGETPGREDTQVCAAALNHKFEQSGVRAQIKYAAGKGFELVTNE